MIEEIKELFEFQMKGKGLDFNIKLIIPWDVSDLWIKSDKKRIW